MAGRINKQWGPLDWIVLTIAMAIAAALISLVIGTVIGPVHKDGQVQPELHDALQTTVSALIAVVSLYVGAAVQHRAEMQARDREDNSTS